MRRHAKRWASHLTLLLVGATGLVGRSVLIQALADSRIERVVAPARRPLEPVLAARGELHRSNASALENPIIDFEHLPADPHLWTVDAVVCAVGTTIRKAGSQDAFRRVDHDYPLAIARLARAHGARAFALTSAMGANPSSRIFYNRVKGETEVSVSACGFPSLTIVRPGLIGGVREESRPAESAARAVLGVLAPVLPRRYRINPAAHIARALLDAAVRAEPGVHIVSSGDLV